ncbi:MAG: glycosyltransferase [Pseudomonadota bacterium]
MKKDKKKLNILQLSTFDIGGGAEGSAWNLYNGFKKHGHNSWLAVGSKRTCDKDVFLIPNDQYGSFLRKTLSKPKMLTNKLTFKLHHFKRLEKLFHYAGEPRSYLDSLKGYEDYNYPGSQHILNLTPIFPDILHCHNLHTDYFDLRALSSLSKRLPIILNIRDAWLLTGHCAHSFDCEKWVDGCGSCPDLSIYPAIKKDGTAFNWRRKKEIYAQSRLYITTPSEWMMDSVKRSMLVGVDYRIIPNGIDLEIFKPENKIIARQKLNLPLDKKIILFVANGGKGNIWKDYNTIKKTIEYLTNASKIENMLFICLGDKGLINLNIQSVIKNYPFELDPRKVAMYYQAADIYLHASKVESFGKTITEAMACGTAVIASSVAAIPEQIQDSINGFLIQPSDYISMAERTMQLLNNNNLRKRFIQAGMQIVKKKYDINIQISSFLEWYREILENK